MFYLLFLIMLFVSNLSVLLYILYNIVAIYLHLMINYDYTLLQLYRGVEGLW